MRAFFTHPVTWGALVTGLIAIAAISIGVSPLCVGEADCVNKWTVFLESRPNEIGDTLAGFAGALAFVWIIVTVWLQSRELSAQREELQLTRQEMEGQRVAAENMAEAMKAQAQLAEAQVQTLMETRALELAEVYLQEILYLNTWGVSPTWSYLKTRNDQTRLKGETDLSIPFKSSGSIEKDASIVAQEVRRCVEEIFENDAEGWIEKYPEDKTYARELKQLGEDFVKICEDLSVADRRRLERVHIRDLVDRLEDLLSSGLWREPQ